LYRYYAKVWKKKMMMMAFLAKMLLLSLLSLLRLRRLKDCWWQMMNFSYLTMSEKKTMSDYCFLLLLLHLHL
jgi:hypothetical protein